MIHLSGFWFNCGTGSCYGYGNGRGSVFGGDGRGNGKGNAFGDGSGDGYGYGYVNYKNNGRSIIFVYGVFASNNDEDP